MKLFIPLGLLFTIFFLYFYMPVLAFGFYGILTLMILLLFFFGVFQFKSVEKSALVTALSITVVVIISFVSSASMFHSSDYRELLGNVEKKEFSKDVAPIDVSKVRVVDEKLATKLGEKLLGSDPALGSITVLGDFSIQLVQGKLYWVSPLLHSGYFKWWSSEGTPGYIMVSATNPSDVKLITELDGKQISIRFQDNAYFTEDIHRHLYLNGYKTVGLTDFSFELDEELNPFYVVTIYDNTVGFFGEEAQGILVVNPQNGEIKEYSMTEIPEWVDRVQPENFITTQINDWGLFNDGWWNATFTKKGTLKASDGMSLIYGSDNKSYWYTGMTSLGKDNSTVGFILVDTKTKESKWYKQSGATESKAANSASGEVQEKGYYATSPILYNVLGLPTYITTLKDNEGLVKLIAFISVEQYSIVGTGKTIKEALRNYKSLLSQNSGQVLTSNYDTVNIKGKVLRISMTVKGSNSFYYFTVDSNNSKNKVFVSSTSINEDIILTKSNDIVEIKFEKNDNKFTDLVSFENITLSK